MICIRCNADLESGATTEHKQLQTLADWLCEATCIPWRKGHLNQSTNTCEQYGIIDIESSSLIEITKQPNLTVYEHSVDVDDNGCPAKKICQSIQQNEQIVITLIVKNDQGDKVSCDTPSGAYTKTAMDVLRHIRTLTFSEHKKPTGVEWIDRASWTISNTYMDDKQGNPCEQRAEMTITVNFCQTISVPIENNVFTTCQVIACGETKDFCEEQYPDCEE